MGDLAGGGAAPVQAGAAPGLSYPIYPHRHAGPVLVCGFAQTFWDDLKRAQAIYPTAPLIGVNGLSEHIKLFALFSLHVGPNKLGRWADKQHRRFGPDCTIHAHGDREQLEKRQRLYPYVQHWWPDAAGVGTSTWAAVKMAKMMGFGPIVICGMPLERMPYGDMSFARDFRRRDVTRIYREYVARDTAWHEGVFAMSGWTRKFFGEPPHGDRDRGAAATAGGDRPAEQAV